MSTKTNKFVFRLFSILMLFSLMSSAMGVSPAHAAGLILYATPGASGTGDCQSWENACTLQTALTTAVSGDELWVAAGTHKPATDGDRSATFQLKVGVALYGGFAGTETTRDQRNFEVNLTILSGDLNGDDLGFTNNAENVYHVVSGASGATLDGFTVTAGNANGGGTLDYGGGMLNYSSNPTLTNAVIINGYSPNAYGGGMYNDSSSPMLTNVTFSGNSATMGGGMYNLNGSNPTLANVTFSGNSTKTNNVFIGNGGGMANYSLSSPTLTNVTFNNNTSGSVGGGMFNYLSSNPTLTNVTFNGNSASDEGGGMYNNSSSPELTNVTFNGNSASGGGGMYNDSSSPELTNVTFSGNSAIYDGGGMRNGSSHPTLTAVTFSGNSAKWGGGMENNSSNPTLINVTFSGNSVTGDGGGMTNFESSNPTLANVTFSANTATGTSSSRGGGMYNNDSSPTLTDVIFSDNSASVGGGMSNWSNSSPTLSNVTFSGNSADAGGGMLNISGSSPTLLNVTFSDNTAKSGGGIYSIFSSPMLMNVTISGNSADLGGGMLNISGSSPTLLNVTFSDNTASNGGGMENYNNSSPALTNVTFRSNSAGDGGGMFNSDNSSPVLSNVTFSGNSADAGGGMFNSDGSNPTLTSVTFSGNSARYFGGGMSNVNSTVPQIRNSLFWGNTAPDGAQIYNLYDGSTPSVSDSVVQGGCPEGSTCTNIITVDPMLGSLGDYGGFTQTIPLLAGSSAIDTGNDATCPATDQRGITRPQGAHCDIGAYEFGETRSISGNAGIASANLSYTDGTPKTATVDGAGNYSITVPSGWTGTITPWKSGSGFTPFSRSYTNVTANQTGQDYTAATCPTTDVTIGGSLSGSYCLTSGQSTRQSYAANNGPVKVVSTGATPILAAQRILYYANGVPTSFVEMSGLPESQLSATWWFPWYKNVGEIDTQLRLGNVSGAPASVHVYIGGVEMPGSPFGLTASGAGQSTRLSFAGVNDGPVRVVSDVNVVASERLLYYANGAPTSFSEMLGVPNGQLNSTWWLPWYKNIPDDVDTQLRLGNVSGSPASVHVYIGGVEMTGSPFSLTASGAGQSTRLSFAGVNAGPVQVVSDVNVVVSERLLYSANGAPTSFVEMLGLPNSQLSTTWWLPWYKNVGEIDTQLRLGNVSGTPATVHVYIGGVEMPGSPFSLTASGAGQSMRLSFAGVNAGPVQIVSDVNVVVSERLLYSADGMPTSFSEMLGVPNGQLSSTWWLPWYKNVGEIDTQLRFGMP